MQGTKEKDFYTTGDLARMFGVKLWKVARLFEDGLVAQPQRFRNYRLIPKKQIPAIEKALRKRGYLTDDKQE